MFRTAFPPPAALCNGRDKAYLLFFNGFLQYIGEVLTCQEEIALFFPLRYNERVLHYAADRLHHAHSCRYQVKEFRWQSYIVRSLSSVDQNHYLLIPFVKSSRKKLQLALRAQTWRFFAPKTNVTRKVVLRPPPHDCCTI